MARKVEPTDSVTHRAIGQERRNRLHPASAPLIGTGFLRQRPRDFSLCETTDVEQDQGDIAMPGITFISTTSRQLKMVSKPPTTSGASASPTLPPSCETTSPALALGEATGEPRDAVGCQRLFADA